MKKQILWILPCIAAIAIVTFLGKKTFEFNMRETNSLLLLNVEALSDGDDAWDSGSNCSFGDPIYGIVYSISGTEHIVMHYMDGIDGKPGTDLAYSQSFYGCVASGNGPYKGSNYTMIYNISQVTYPECKGKSGHNSTSIR